MVVHPGAAFTAANPFRSSAPLDCLYVQLLSTQMALGLECRGRQILLVSIQSGYCAKTSYNNATGKERPFSPYFICPLLKLISTPRQTQGQANIKGFYHVPYTYVCA